MAKLNINIGGLQLDLGFDIGQTEIGAILSFLLSAEDDESKRKDILEVAGLVLRRATDGGEEPGEHNRRSTDREQVSEQQRDTAPVDSGNPTGTFAGEHSERVGHEHGLADT